MGERGRELGIGYPLSTPSLIMHLVSKYPFTIKSARKKGIVECCLLKSSEKYRLNRLDLDQTTSAAKQTPFL